MQQTYEEFEEALKLFSELQQEYQENKQELQDQKELRLELDEGRLRKEREDIKDKLNKQRGDDYILTRRLKELRE